jgi:hypothetical protein
MGKLPTVLPTARRPSAVDISQRVVKKLWSCATFTDGHHRQKSHIPKRTPVRGTITDGIAGDPIFDGNFRRDYRRIENKGGIFEIFGAHFNLFPSELPMEINATDNIYVPSVISTEMLAYKTVPPPPLVHFFSWLSSLFLLHFV